MTEEVYESNIMNDRGVDEDDYGTDAYDNPSEDDDGEHQQRHLSSSMSRSFVINKALTYHMESARNKMSVRQTRRDWCQELIGIEGKTEFKFYKDDDKHYFASAIEDSDSFCRVCCSSFHPFKMSVVTQTPNSNNFGEEEKSNSFGEEEELLLVERPCSCASGPCKCCCYQEAFVYTTPQPSSTTQQSFQNTVNAEDENTRRKILLGTITETCWFCVPSFVVEKYNNNTGDVGYSKPRNNGDDDNNDNIEKKYIIHPKTCCCFGCCRYCCEEGNPCTEDGCCKVGLYVFPYEQRYGGKTNGKDAEYVGSIVKKPKSLTTELYTDANIFDIDFPLDSTTSDKALLVGSSIFFNSMFFEGGE